MNKPSVSQIVSEIFPTDPLLFQNALTNEAIIRKIEKGELYENGIAYKSQYLNSNQVMDVLTSFGTHIHSLAFDKGILGIEYPLPEFCKQHSSLLYDFINKYHIKFLYGEKHIETDEYTGTVDAVVEMDGKIYAVDFKTWTAYKYLYGFKNPILKRNGEPKSRSNDIKKVSLQLSLYKDGLEQQGIHIDGLKVIWITEQGIFPFDCTYDISLYEEWKRIKNNPITL